MYDSKQIMLAKTKKKSFHRPKGFTFNKIVNQELQAELNTMEKLKIKNVETSKHTEEK